MIDIFFVMLQYIYTTVQIFLKTNSGERGINLQKWKGKVKCVQQHFSIYLNFFSFSEAKEVFKKNLVEKWEISVADCTNLLYSKM